MTADEYLALEEHSQIRHEFVHGELFAMTGGTFAHNDIIGNLYTALRTHLQGTACRVNFTDIKVQSGPDFYYPDVVVSCEKREPHDKICREPVLLIEVLSDSTTKYDQTEKKEAYLSIESLKEYVTVSQDSRFVTVYRREQSEWKTHRFLEEDAVMLTAVDLTLPVREIYAEV